MATPIVDPVALALHELRAPLGLIATAARSVADECEEESLRLRCDMIVRAVEGLLRTAREVLTLHDACATAAPPAPFRPAETVDELVLTLRGYDVPVLVTLGPGAPEAEIAGNGEAYRALLHSLLTNALDHAEPGRAIEVGLCVDDSTVTATVRNAARGGKPGRGLGSIVVGQLAAKLGVDVERRSVDGQFEVAVIAQRVV